MANTPVRSSFPTVVAIIGVLLVFALLLNYNYISGDREAAVDTPERPSLAEHRAAEAQTLNSAKVIDAASGKVRLPIERAKELVVKENSQ